MEKGNHAPVRGLIESSGNSQTASSVRIEIFSNKIDRSKPTSIDLYMQNDEWKAFCDGIDLALKPRQVSEKMFAGVSILLFISFLFFFIRCFEEFENFETNGFDMKGFNRPSSSTMFLNMLPFFAAIGIMICVSIFAGYQQNQTSKEMSNICSEFTERIPNLSFHVRYEYQREDTNSNRYIPRTRSDRTQINHGRIPVHHLHHEDHEDMCYEYQYEITNSNRYIPPTQIGRFRISHTQIDHGRIPVHPLHHEDRDDMRYEYQYEDTNSDRYIPRTRIGRTQIDHGRIPVHPLHHEDRDDVHYECQCEDTNSDRYIPRTQIGRTQIDHGRIPVHPLHHNPVTEYIEVSINSNQVSEAFVINDASNGDTTNRTIDFSNSEEARVGSEGVYGTDSYGDDGSGSGIGTTSNFVGATGAYDTGADDTGVELLSIPNTNPTGQKQPSTETEDQKTRLSNANSVPCRPHREESQAYAPTISPAESGRSPPVEPLKKKYLEKEEDKNNDSKSIEEKTDFRQRLENLNAIQHLLSEEEYALKRKEILEEL